jgi:hypothetical protein
MPFFKPNIQELVRNKDIKRLVNACLYPDMQIRRNATQALAKLKDPESVPPLCSLLSSTSTSSRSREHLTEIARVLGEIGNERALEALLMHVDMCSVRYCGICTSAAVALSHRGVEAARELIARKLFDWPWVRDMGLSLPKALATFADDRAISLLYQVSECDLHSSEDRLEAVDLLASFGDRAEAKLAQLMTVRTPICERAEQYLKSIAGPLLKERADKWEAILRNLPVIRGPRYVDWNSKKGGHSSRDLAQELALYEWKGCEPPFQIGQDDVFAIYTTRTSSGATAYFRFRNEEWGVASRWEFSD